MSSIIAVTSFYRFLLVLYIRFLFFCFRRVLVVPIFLYSDCLLFYMLSVRAPILLFSVLPLLLSVFVVFLLMSLLLFLLSLSVLLDRSPVSSFVPLFLSSFFLFLLLLLLFHFSLSIVIFLFFCIATPTTFIYTLSLHPALPIYLPPTSLLLSSLLFHLLLLPPV